MSELHGILDDAALPFHDVPVQYRSTLSANLILWTCTTECHKKSFLPVAIKLFNSSIRESKTESIDCPWTYFTLPEVIIIYYLWSSVPAVHFWLYTVVIYWRMMHTFGMFSYFSILQFSIMMYIVAIYLCWLSFLNFSACFSVLLYASIYIVIEIVFYSRRWAAAAWPIFLPSVIKCFWFWNK